MAIGEKKPAFQFYPKDWQSDERVKLMSHTERGIYIDLLCHCWLEGSLPFNPADLAKIVNIPTARFKRIWEGGPLHSCFQVSERGRLVHKRLDAEREKQRSYSRRQSDAALSKWRSHSDAVALPNACPRDEDEEEDRRPEKEKGTAAPKLSANGRAGNLREVLYPQWYAKHRHGARLRLIANSLEYQDAVSLCETWDDATLEKLAAIVLTTNDEWISNTDRSFRIFALKASWAHDRLAQWELEQAKKRPA